MPPLISFMLTRLAIGFAIGGIAGAIVWINGLSEMFPSPVWERWLAQGLFIYLFASTIGGGYLATALFQNDD
ncbi:hypothetical protein [Rhizobium leguminosarum]|uniref:hypothetical protein n=1 Tax=Rhizobium leguminosarum TaxID=384 RepID=UPI001440F8E8|nr:hypothetical protein [Rhizobium leguminosarum]MBY5814639.1 hypothetical protein [Rhizobium leguminosarum]NKL78188.1 hypothetical protein [Rhizobium leguminosarum bv. viciae]